jgi:hypothetical protein
LKINTTTTTTTTTTTNNNNNNNKYTYEIYRCSCKFNLLVNIYEPHYEWNKKEKAP